MGSLNPKRRVVRMEGSEKVECVVEENKRFIWEHHIGPLVSRDLIEEHRADPFGLHSPALDIVLGFLRSDPVRSKPQYVIMCIEPEREWAVGEHPRRRGASIHAPEDAERFRSVAEAEHAVFLRRLSDLGVDPSDLRVGLSA